MKQFKKSTTFFLITLISLSLILTGCIGISTKSPNKSSGSPNTSTNSQLSPADSVFDGDCGISASAEIENNIIGFPELKITVKNTGSKEISAIKFYAVPLDVYGEEIKGWTTQNYLYTDDPIPAGKTDTLSYQFIEQSVKTVKLYVYSVYFSDGSEWGDKDALPSTIIDSAPTIELAVDSEVNSDTSSFDGDCGISASAEIGKNIINYPELKITITNTGSKEISAIKFYAVPLDVYGEEIKSWTTQNYLYTDDPIPAGKTDSLSYQLIEQSVKNVNLYVYSVYFSDGSEWGDKDALPSAIIDGAPTIAVVVK